MEGKGFFNFLFGSIFRSGGEGNGGEEIPRNPIAPLQYWGIWRGRGGHLKHFKRIDKNNIYILKSKL